MTAVERTRAVGVIGTGTMGQGIAQVALLAGHPVRLYDAVEGRAGQAADALAARLDRLVDKGRMDTAAREQALSRLHPAADLTELFDVALAAEAVVEDVRAKQELFAALEDIVSDDCLLATNTSSLSVTEIAGALRGPERFVGLHFFNPAPLLPLVEVVSGSATSADTADLAHGTALAWGKTPVRCSDTPGFVVNRIARPFYAEAFALYEERAADPATVDAVLRECGGFRMGPFELTDLIGQDVNEAVTRSVWDAFFHDPRFTPSLAQRRLVQSGRLGRKSGLGWFPHGEDAARPAPHTADPCEPPGSVTVHGDLGPASVLRDLLAHSPVAVTSADAAARPGGAPGPGGGHIALPGGTRLGLTSGAAAGGDDRGPYIAFDLSLDYRACTRVALASGAGADPADLRAAVGLFQALGKQVSVVADAPGLIVARTVARIVDLALDAAARGVAGEDDIDTAMRLGVNYPGGPFEWCAHLGAPWVHRLLRRLEDEHGGGRYAPSRALALRARTADRAAGR
jgi:3-hydroxybutyryl-CoA dehydrogenase